MLTGKKIIEEVRSGNITISPFIEDNVGPNSYDLHWGNVAIQVLPNMDGEYIDMREPAAFCTRYIPETGMIIEPGELYLIATDECVGSSLYVPQIVGRSSIGRMGISVSPHAAFGDLGYFGKWTLQVSSVMPVKIYPHMRVCHVFFEEVVGDTAIAYRGRYQGADGPMPNYFQKFE